MKPVPLLGSQDSNSRLRISRTQRGTPHTCHLVWSLSVLFLALPLRSLAEPLQWGFWEYTTNGATANITRYLGDHYGAAGDVTVPNSIYGCPVTSIADYAFGFCKSMTNVTIPFGVTSIGVMAFNYCANLRGISIPNSVQSIGFECFEFCSNLCTIQIPYSVTNIGERLCFICNSLTRITVDPQNAFYSDLDGVLFDKYQTLLLDYPIGNGIRTYTVPSGVASIGPYAVYGATNLANVVVLGNLTNVGIGAFCGCTSLSEFTFPRSLIAIQGGAFYSTGLTCISLPASLTSLGDAAFCRCYNLTNIYFEGNAPSVVLTAFGGDTNTTVYYLPGTTGWGSTFAGVPAVLWNPQVQTSDGEFGLNANGFGFNITGTANISIAVEACADPTTRNWTSVQACTLTNGSIYFSDSQWTNWPTRFYRIRPP